MLRGDIKPRISAGINIHPVITKTAAFNTVEHHQKIFPADQTERVTDQSLHFKGITVRENVLIEVTVSATRNA